MPNPNVTARSMLGAGVGVTLGSLLAQGANLGRDVAFAVSFGSNLKVDCFFLATMVPIFLATVATAAFRSTIVPVLERVAQARGEGDKRAIVLRAARAGVVTVAAVACLLALSAPWSATVIAGRLPEGAARLVTLFTWATLPMLAMSCYAALADGPLQTYGRFFYPTALRAAVPLGMALGALIWPSRDGLFAASIGGAIGASCQLLAVFVLLRSAVPRQPIRLAAPTDAMAAVRAQFLLLSASVSIQYVGPIIDQWMASFLGAGAVSAMTYASRLAVGAASIAAGSIGPVLLPLFSRVIARADRHALNRHYVSALRLTFWAGLLLTGLIWLASEPAVGLLYEHGKFARADTYLVSQVLACLALQFPMLLPGIVSATVISAAAHNRFFLPLTLGTAISNATGNLALMQWFGLAGIALSTVLTYALSLAAMNVHLHRAGLIDLPRGLALEAAAAAATAGVLALLILAFDLRPGVVPTVSQVAASLCGLGLLGAVAYRFTRPDIAALTGRVAPASAA